MISRTLKLCRRTFAASRLGFSFSGTTRTAFPRVVRLMGRKVALSAPEDGGYLNDIINVWLDDEYGLRELKAPPRTILDIGANIGLFSLWAAHHFPHATIHAYEPNPRISPYTQANLAGTGVRIHEEAIGLRSGRARMVDLADSRLASTSAANDGGVQVVGLMEAVERLGGTVDLIKMDCEGAEWEILRDLPALKSVSTIRMEYHLVGGASVADFAALTRTAGFTTHRFAPNQGFGIVWLGKPRQVQPDA